MFNEKTGEAEYDIRSPRNIQQIEFQVNTNITQIQTSVQRFGEISITERQRDMPRLKKLQQVQIPAGQSSQVTHLHSFLASIFDSAIQIRGGCFISNDKLLLYSRDTPMVFVCRLEGIEIHHIKLKH